MKPIKSQRAQRKYSRKWVWGKRKKLSNKVKNVSA